ncbi:transporter substrate-binding domain-containing protein [Acidisoma sp.]|uniref:transporter substrate-binding domain-containing protein n=1 Tax=Acidisoma sp. TaxID=1872115 RepID=UPI003AFFF261
MKKLFAAGALAATVLGLTGQVPAQAKAFTQITYGVDATYPPFESLSPSGQFQGFDIDLGKAICAYLKVRCVFVSQTFDSIIPALQARKFDAILSSLSKTAARAKVIDFSTQMYDEPTSLIAKKGAGLKPTADSLKGKTIGVESGTVQESYANTYWKPNGVNIVSYAGQDQVYSDLLAGRLDASLQDSVEADFGFLKTPKGAGYALVADITYDPKDVLGSYAAIGVRKDEPELLKNIDEAIAAIHANGTYDKLQSKYFNFSIYEPSANP